MSTLDAAFRLAHGYPGGASALALRMGKHPATLCHELTGAGSAKLGLLDAVMLSHLTGSTAIAQAFAAELGGVFLPLAPEIMEQGGDLAALGASIREFGEFASTFATSLADGSVTGNELQAMEREALEAIGAITQALALAKANASPEQGLIYLRDFVFTYHLYLPVALALALYLAGIAEFDLVLRVQRQALGEPPIKSARRSTARLPRGACTTSASCTAGTVRCNGSNDVVGFNMIDGRYLYLGENIILSSTAGTGAYQTVSMATFVPPHVRRVHLVALATNSSGSPDAIDFRTFSTSGIPATFDANSFDERAVSMATASDAIDWLAAATLTIDVLSVRGWEE